MRSLGKQFMRMVLVAIFFVFCVTGRVILAAEMPADVREELLSIEISKEAGETPEPEVPGEETGEIPGTEIPGEGTGETPGTEIPGEGTEETPGTEIPGEGTGETPEPETPGTEIPGGGTGETPEPEAPGEGTEETPEPEAPKEVKNGWDRSDPGGKVYYYVDGNLQVGFQEIEGKKYYFSPKSGKMLTGKQKIGKSTYYFKKSGEQQKGWVKIKGKKYYFSKKNGKMLTGKQKIGKSTYYFKKSGARQTGWVKIKGKKYYFSKKTAKMLTGKQKIGKSTYYFKKSGARQTGWVKIKGKKYYFSKKTAKMLTGKQKIGKNAYYFNKKGIMQTSKWIKKGDKTYYCLKNGVLQTGWLEKDGRKYYFSVKNNEMQTGWVQIDGFKYYFISSGNQKGAQQAGGIVGTGEEGFYYTDAAGRQITDPTVMQAVSFVKAHTNDAWSNDVKLQQCYEYLWRNYSYQRFLEKPSVESMPGYANYMFSAGKGNCFRYAASLAYIAKVLGYESRVAVGGISSPRGGMSPHGWTEINVAGTWYICDANMQKNFPHINSYMCTEASYGYRHSCSARYTLIIQDGAAFWQ